MQVITFVLLGAAVMGMCHLLGLKPAFPKIEKPKRSALCSLAAASVSMLIILALMMIGAKHGHTQGMGHKHQRHWEEQLFLVLVYFVPMLLMLRLNGETLRSAGLTRANLWKATIVGLFLAATTIFFAPGGPGAVFKFTESHNIDTLIYFGFVGFSEEIFFRGYLQSRLVAWLGQFQGWVLASIVMALFHIPQRILAAGLDFPHALASSLGLVSISLLMGFVMLRTGNVVAGGLFHTFLDW